MGGATIVSAAGEPDAWVLPGVGARPGGMGGAFIGLADDVETVYYNPGGLGHLGRSAATAMYQTPTLETSRAFLGAAYAWSRRAFLPGSMAIGWTRLSSADIEITSEVEQVLGTDSLRNDLIQMGSGFRVLDHWAAGLGAKIYRFSFHGFQETGYGLDAGAHGIYGPLRLGAVFSDIGGTRLCGDSTAGGHEVCDRVPARFRPGAALALERPFRWPVDLNLAMDWIVKMQGAQQTRLHMGAEAWLWHHTAAIRFGFQQYNGPTMGFGLHGGPVRFDYAFLLSQNLKDEHRLGTTFLFK